MSAGAVANKNVLQQANVNVPVSVEPRPESEKVVALRRKRRVSQEAENVMSDTPMTNKLRKVRLESVSSQKLKSYRLEESDDDGRGDDEREVEDDEDGGGKAKKTKKKKKKEVAPRPIIPNYVSKGDKDRKRRKPKTEAAVNVSSQSLQEPAKAAEMSMSVARRNARERNRVKLVNEGFATLRSCIPDYISNVYSDKKKNPKKPSKVETLRMALGYIRHLTEMLELRSTDPEAWYRVKTEAPSTANASPECQPSPAHAPQDCTFYDYDVSVKEEPDDSETLIIDVCSHDEEDAAVEPPGKESPVMSENEYSVDIGCCYDVDTSESTIDVEEVQEEPEKKETVQKLSPLPSMTESFPKKSLMVFYEAPPFLAASATFHV